ncbi:MAG: DNA helicase UvrD, partial [bacterium]|nr:DNA helicase UvrD [bacterium]
HRLCKIRFSPEETKKHKGICPVCNRPLTVGVMSRVDELADRPTGFKPKNAVPFKSLVPLEEIIGEAFGLGVAAKKVKEEYKNLIEKFGNEFAVLIDADLSQLKSAVLPEIFEGISRVREGKLKIEPGYDGEYGKVKIFDEKEREKLASQKSLF